MAYKGDMLSRPVCHFGGFFGGLGLPILRRCRTAMRTNATPMAIFTASAASEGAVLGFGGLFPVTRTVRATTMARESNHPKMKAAPFRVPPLDSRMRMKAVRGIGWGGMTGPMGRRPKITAGGPGSL